MQNDLCGLDPPSDALNNLSGCSSSTGLKVPFEISHRPISVLGCGYLSSRTTLKIFGKPITRKNKRFTRDEKFAQPLPELSSLAGREIADAVAPQSQPGTFQVPSVLRAHKWYQG